MPSLAGRFSRETIRVFPMRLTVTGYSPPPEAPEDFDELSPQDRLPYLLPIINVEGQSTGSDLDETADRNIRGTVSMIGDCTVRWTLVRC